MTVFEAGYVVLVIQQIAVVQSAMASLDIRGQREVPAATREKLTETLDLAERLFASRPVGTCLHDVQSVIFESGKPTFTNAIGAALLSQLRGRITRELDSRKFIRIPDGNEPFVDNERLFGDKVYEAFPSARQDLREAGNCLAVECNTAAVFHLMRASEHGLRCLVRAVGVTAPRIPLEFQEWNNLLEQVESRVEAAQLYRWGQPSKGNAQAFFNATVADYYAFKDAIRNITMHTRASGSYDASSAGHIRNQVGECLRRLAEHVVESNPARLILLEAEFV